MACERTAARRRTTRRFEREPPVRLLLGGMRHARWFATEALRWFVGALLLGGVRQKRTLYGGFRSIRCLRRTLQRVLAVGSELYA